MAYGPEGSRKGKGRRKANCCHTERQRQTRESVDRGGANGGVLKGRG